MSSKLEQIRSLNAQAWAICKVDGPKAIQLARQVQALLADCAEAQPTDEFECLKTQTYCLDMLSRPDEALLAGLKANDLAKHIGDKYLIGSIQSLLGRIYWHIDDLATSMDYYLKALNLVQTENHPDLEMSLINGLGLVQYGLENYTEALAYFKTCLAKAGETDLTGRADANNNIAYVLHILGRDAEALEYGLAALALFNRLGTSVGKMETLHSLGAVYLALEQYDQALSFLQQGFELSRQTNSQLLEISYVLEICRIRQRRGELDQAEQELRLALTTAEAINSLANISLLHERLAALYKEKGDYQSALGHFEAYHATYRKVFNERSDRRVKNLEVLHQVEITRQQANLYRELAGTDFLTGLANRRHFLEIAEAAWQQANSEHGQLAIIMLDIDHFKRVNDRYGHKIGDEVLSAVAAGIKKSLRQDDLAGRYGGEEFIVLLLRTGPDQCAAIAERIRQAVAQRVVRIDEAVVRVTISLGLACLQRERVLPLDDLIKGADQALYLAKEQGRDRLASWAQAEPAKPDGA